MVVFGGFMNSKNCVDYSNTISKYHFGSNTWTIINSKSQLIPEKRSNCGGTIVDNGLVIFGGINGKLRFNDLWRFDFETEMWKQIKGTGSIPKVIYLFIIQ